MVQLHGCNWSAHARNKHWCRRLQRVLDCLSTVAYCSFWWHAVLVPFEVSARHKHENQVVLSFIKTLHKIQNLLTSLATLWKTVAHLSKAEEIAFKNWTLPADSSWRVTMAWSRTGWPGKLIAWPEIEYGEAELKELDCCILKTKLGSACSLLAWFRCLRSRSRLRLFLIDIDHAYTLPPTVNLHRLSTSRRAAATCHVAAARVAVDFGAHSEIRM